MTLDYGKSGVDTAKGDALVDWLQQNSSGGPHQDKIISGIGGFAALFKADFSGMKEPCLVSCTDGVGTKVKLAAQFGRYREVAQDMVAMCVNDLVCSGAKPLFFLDYYATGKLNLQAAQEFLLGVRQACHESGCALIGGETAEMPGVYGGDDFDCAGFAVGVVDRAEVLGASKVSVGDVLLGVSSSGFHSNGFSLLRQVFAGDLDKWFEELIKPTALYPALVEKLLGTGGVKALAHITGGGMDNIPRVLPVNTRAQLRPWPVPAPFVEVKKRSGQTWAQMLTTLNCGIGMVAVVSPENATQLEKVIVNQGYKVFPLGTIEAGKGEAAWVMDAKMLEELG